MSSHVHPVVKAVWNMQNCHLVFLGPKFTKSELSSLADGTLFPRSWILR